MNWIWRDLRLAAVNLRRSGGKTAADGPTRDVAVLGGLSSVPVQIGRLVEGNGLAERRGWLASVDPEWTLLDVGHGEAERSSGSDEGRGSWRSWGNGQV